MVKVDALLQEAYKLAWEAWQPDVYAANLVACGLGSRFDSRGSGPPAGAPAAGRWAHRVISEASAANQAMRRLFFCDLPMDGVDGSLTFLTKAIIHQLGLAPLARADAAALGNAAAS